MLPEKTFHKSISLPTENRLWLKPTVVPAGKLGKPEQERRQLDSIAASDASDACSIPVTRVSNGYTEVQV